jgi:signal transduction histidine kinase
MVSKRRNELPGAAPQWSEKRYHALFEAIDQGFCVVEVLFSEAGAAEDYVFLETNPAFIEQTGIENAVGKRMRQIAPAHEAYWFEIYGRVARTGEAIRFENEAKQLGHFYEVFAFRVGEPHENQVGILFNDISERKRVEQELRTANLLKDEFLGLVSHELRTPLTTIRGNAAVLAEQKNLPEEARDAAIRDILQEAKRLTGLVENMLVLGRLEAGKQLPLEPLLLSRTIPDSVNAFLEQTPDAIVKITREIAPIIFLGNNESVEQILHNLLGNAHKYSPSPSVIELSTDVHDGYARVSVADRGRGIQPDSSLFAAFSREPEAAATVPGLGLGLTVCKRLVEALGGEIEAMSRDGGGSVFSFTLPIVED